MRRAILKNQLLNFLQVTPGWHKKVSLFVLAEQWGYSPESAGRRLRELADEGKITTGYYDGRYAKRLRKYTADDKPKTGNVEIVELPDGRRVVRMI